MTWRGKPGTLRLLRQTKGSAAVEFALISVVFFLLVAGIIDFGHAWYMRQVITNASREGARYGITYRTNASGDRIAPDTFNPSIETMVSNYLSNASLPSDADPHITPGGSGFTSTNKGDSLEVTVTATKTWFIISGFIPGMDQQTTITAKTVMLLE
jgi:Flp pilus assembly protein TadG